METGWRSRGPRFPGRGTVSLRLLAAPVLALAAVVLIPRPPPSRHDDLQPLLRRPRPRARPGRPGRRSAAPYGRRVHRARQRHRRDGRATLESGKAGDEVWLDRSFDGGRTWADGSRSATPRSPSGAARLAYRASSTSTTGHQRRRRAAGLRQGRRPARARLHRVDPQHLERVGPAHRRGHRADDAATTAAPACSTTTAGGPAPTRSPPSSTTSSAADEQLPVRHRQHLRQAGQRELGQFRNEYLDDTGWWGLAWVAAYDADRRQPLPEHGPRRRRLHVRLLGHPLRRRRLLEHRPRRKNAITNSLYIQLNAALAAADPGRHRLPQRAQAGWTWFQSTGMLNGNNLVNDGVNLSHLHEQRRRDLDVQPGRPDRRAGRAEPAHRRRRRAGHRAPDRRRP